MMYAPLQAEAAAPVRVPALGRACACGATAGVSGRCAACETRARLGTRPALSLATSEREAGEAARFGREPNEGWTSTRDSTDGPDGIVQRAPVAPAPVAPVDVRPPEQLHVYMKATADMGPIPSEQREEAIGGTVGPYYPGDTIFVQVFKDAANGNPGDLDGIPEPITPTFSSGDVAIAETLQSRFMLRVVGDPGPTAVEMTLASPAFAQPLTVWIVLDSAPAAPDVHDPEAESLGAAVEELRGEREAHRAERRTQRRDFRAARRAAGPAERKAMRAERKATREEGKQLRRDLRAARGALVDYDETAEFSRHRQGLIQAAIERGIAKAANAIARAAPGRPPADDVALGLEKYFKLTSTPATATQVRETLQRIVDVLSLARTSMLTAGYGQFELGEDCDEETGAYVSERARGKAVTICKDWIEGEPDFGVTTSKSDGQAYALLHEFVHLSGISASGDEVYNHQGEWEPLTGKEALTMADAYTAFAWTLGGGS